MMAATAARRITLSPRALVRTAGAKRRMGHDAHGEGHHPHVSGIENENIDFALERDGSCSTENVRHVLLYSMIADIL